MSGLEHPFVPRLRVFGVLAFGAMAMAVHAQPMEHNAFLRKHVQSAQDLVTQVSTDPVVLARYQAHFGLSKNQLKAWFAQLRLKPLTASHRYGVYNVDANLVIRKRELLLPKGTYVFVNPAGKPVLKKSCGNPLTNERPPTPKPIAKRVLGPKMEGVVPEPPLVTETVPPETVEYVPPVANPVTPVVAPETLTAPAISAPVAMTPTTGLNLSPFLPIAGLIPILIPSHGGHHDGGGSEPVPEPASIAVVAVGAVAICRRRRRRGR